MKTSLRSTSLSDVDLQHVAPAIFAEAPAAHTSARYAFLKTIEVVNALRGEGWVPVYAAQGAARSEVTEGVQKHVVRFRKPGVDARVGDSVTELVLTNAHDATSAYQVMCGLFRVACSNGLVIPCGTFGGISVRHTGVTTDQVVDASYQVVKEIPRIGESVEAMRSVQLDDLERQAFANVASRLRWGDDEAPLEAKRLLTRRRWEDAGSDLWSTFNVVQENITKGGLRGTAHRRVRAIGSVATDLKINKGLWGIAEEIQRLKAAKMGEAAQALVVG
jgi:hypothetical protein